MFNDAHDGAGRPANLLVPSYVRASGGVRIVFGQSGGKTHALRRAESGGYRVRFPRVRDQCEAVLINTGGGMAGGDHMTVDLSLEPNAKALVTTQAAEKIYRAQEAPTEVDVRLSLGEGSDLAWIPQETILFSGSRWRRRLELAMDAKASATILESVVFGRLAMNERMVAGFCHDRWRIRRAGQLVFAEDLRLDGDWWALLAPDASGGGARALATILHIASDAEQRLDEARYLLAASRSECGASAWNGMLLLRFVARDPQALREDLIGVLEKFRHGPVPRSW